MAESSRIGVSKIKPAQHAFCILGDKRIFKAKSAAMFTAVMQHAYLKGAYVPYQVEAHQLGKAIEALNILHMAGANVASPYKESAITYMDELSEAAQIIGSINTIVINKDLRKGYNTNAIGFTQSLMSVDFRPENKPVVVVGTGGAARAVSFVLNWMKSDIFIVGRNISKAQQLVDKFGGRALAVEDLDQVTNDAKLIVNATSVSEEKEAPELAELVGSLPMKSCELVFDLNYDKADSFWKVAANRHNIGFMDGLPALAHQGSQTLALWTGTTIDPKEFLAALART